MLAGAGFPDAARIFPKEMRAYAQVSEVVEASNRAALLSPHVSAEAAVAGMPEVFERMVEDAEDELTRYCAVTAPTPSQGAEATPRGRGRGAVDVALQTNQYLAWRRVKNPGMTGGRTLNEYWLAESPFPLFGSRHFRWLLSRDRGPRWSAFSPRLVPLSTISWALSTTRLSLSDYA